MGKILYPKQSRLPAASAATSAIVAVPSQPQIYRPPDGVAGDGRRALNGSSAERDQKPSTTTASIVAAAAEPSGTVFVSTCPVCQQCFRNYVSMSQHCRIEHGLRPSDSTFSKYPGKHDLLSGPPLAADTVAAHVAHNLSNWLHGKRSHLLALEQQQGGSSAWNAAVPGSAAATVPASRSPSEGDDDDDRWTADRPALSAFVGQCKAGECGDELAAAAVSPAVCAGPPVLTKMHDYVPAMTAASGGGGGAAAAALLLLNDTPPVLQKCVEHVKPTTYYDEPGAWKFVCLVCHKTFAEKSTLFAHQRSSHSHVACTHLEVEAGCPPEARGRPGSMATAPVPRGARRLANKAEPSFTCVACGEKWRTVHQLHEHILACGASALAPADAANTASTARVKRSAEVAAAVATDASLWRYGKSRRYRKHHSSL